MEKSYPTPGLLWNYQRCVSLVIFMGLDIEPRQHAAQPTGSGGSSGAIRSGSFASRSGRPSSQRDRAGMDLYHRADDGATDLQHVEEDNPLAEKLASRTSGDECPGAPAAPMEVPGNRNQQGIGKLETASLYTAR